MRKRSLRRIYSVSFGLSLACHLLVLGASSLVSLTPRAWNLSRPLPEPRKPLQLLDASSVVPPPATSSGVPLDDRAVPAEAVISSAPRVSASSPGEDGSAEQVEVQAPEGGPGAPSLRERLSGTWDPRLILGLQGPTRLPAPSSMHERLVADVVAAVEASNDRVAAVKRDIAHHLLRGYYPDGRRIMPTDGHVWQLSELLRQNQVLVRDSLQQARVRATRERRDTDRRSYAGPEQ
jgi:hypothetical protein